jgi:signal transduction histidine kinase
VALTFSPGLSLQPLSHKAANVLFRCGQEAVNNALLHSGTTSLEVAVFRDGPFVRVRVVDFGKGFDVDGVARSEQAMGLATMREMCRSVGGRLDVVSTKNSGTTVLAAVKALA